MRHCIESVLAHAGHRLGTLVVVDDASDAPTRALLASLEHPKLRIVRSDRNLGYGGAVNLGVASCGAPFVLQLNSDVEASNDFLSPLVAALDRDPHLAGLNPGGNSYRRYDSARYQRRNGCVVTNHLDGYAFLIRRRIFETLGGFDPRFGRGYFEDSDLTRRILRAGYWVGMHPGTTLHHVSHGSFSSPVERKSLLERNRVIYLERWPAARENVLLASRATQPADLPPLLVEKTWRVLDGGGKVWWVSPESPREMLSLGMLGNRMGLRRAVHRLNKQLRRDPWRHVSAVWIVDDAPRLPAALLRRAARGAGVEPEIWQPARPSRRFADGVPVE